MAQHRIIVISPDREKPLGKRLVAGALAAGAIVQAASTLEKLDKDARADLAVVHLAAAGAPSIDAVAKRFKAPIIAVIPTSSLDGVVKAMKGGKVAAVIVADSFEPAQLTKVAARILNKDVFGLDKLVPWGVRVHSAIVGNYTEKTQAIERISEFAAQMGVRRKYRESIEQCLDELLMNALYDAPVDQTGKASFADVSTKERITMGMEQRALVSYACDGTKFAVSVRDSFGTLKPDTVVRYVEKCLKQVDQIDRKQGGAGLGLYIISSSSTEFLISIHSGVATEATCTFDLEAPKVQLKEFALFSGTTSPPAVMSGAAPGAAAGGGMGLQRGITLLLSTAIVLLLALIAVVAWRH